MNIKELKKAFRIECKTKSGNFYCLSIGNDRRSLDDKRKIFEIDFALNFLTNCFCNRTVVDGDNSYEIIKIITITDKAEVSEFTNVDEFLEYIKSLEIVETVYYLD